MDYYFGRKAYVAAQIGLNGALQALNVISVIQSAQVMDNAIAAIWGDTCAVDLTPFAIDSTGAADSSGSASNSTGQVLPESTAFWSCINTGNLGEGNPWGCHVVITLGFIVTFLITVPMGYF
eukprot:SAG31_NODE_22546_length_523_cov_0.853774_1_plen_121_part_10